MRRTFFVLLFILIALITHTMVLEPRIEAAAEAREASFYYIHRL